MRELPRLTSTWFNKEASFPTWIDEGASYTCTDTGTSSAWTKGERSLSGLIREAPLYGRDKG